MEKPSTEETKNRIKDKIEQIEQFIQELSEIKPMDFEEYLADFGKKAACERYGEKIPQAFIDLALLIIKYKKLPPELSKNLQDAKSMRNFIAHEYGRIDDSIVFEAVDHELERDAEEFINSIKEEIK